MTLRQKILKFIYPLLMFCKQLFKKNIYINTQNNQPFESFYSLSIKLNNGGLLSFNELRGYKILLVNTASNCGYTAQYAELEKLYQQYNNKLKIIAFPSNDFREQEKATDNQIAAFCKKNYGISFQLSSKTAVIGSNKNEVYDWLSNYNKNGWNSQQPQWNFSKYLLDEYGNLIAYFAPNISPLSKQIVQYLEV